MSANPQMTETGFRPNLGRMKVGGLLVAVGGLVAGVGLGLAGIEFALTTRRWIAAQDQTVTAIALQRVRRALEASQAATHAATSVWQGNEGGVRLAS